MITNSQSGTTIDEIADGVYRISTPIRPAERPGGFSYNQYLVVDDEPLMFHTGHHRYFEWTRQAVETVLSVSRLRYLGFSHLEPDECGALNDFLALAPHAMPLCSRVGATVSISDSALRPARALADGQALSIGSREMEWIDAPHLPHNWETGYVFDRRTRTLFCGDLFTQPGHDHPALSAGDILTPSEDFRMKAPAAVSCAPGTQKAFDRMISLAPLTLACMHGSAWHDGTPTGPAALLAALAEKIAS